MGNKRRPRPSEFSRLKKPPKEYSTHPQAQGLHPLGGLYPNRPRAWGLLSGTNTRVPEEEELITINIDSSEQSRVRLQLQPNPRYVNSVSPNTEVMGFASSDD